jgi:large subunit ribosomal protein L1
VTRPNATYELVIKCLMERGMAVPKGRISLPREAKPKSEETILVFAEGRQADEARKAGAHIVGGLELIDGVRFLSFSLSELHSRSIGSIRS